MKRHLEIVVLIVTIFSGIANVWAGVVVLGEAMRLWDVL